MKGPNSNRWYRQLVLLGGIALLTAMLVDTVAVIGRHVRVPLNGSIEIVQFALLISGAAAIVVATITESNALVRLLIDRIPEMLAIWFRRSNQIVSAFYFLALLLGGTWLAVDMWSGHEQSELLGLPYRPLRLIANLAVLATAIVFARRAWQRREPK